MEDNYNDVLKELDDNPTDRNMYESLKNAYIGWKEQSLIQFINNRQKAKISRLNKGDSCIKFFHAKMSLRKHVNN